MCVLVSAAGAPTKAPAGVFFLCDGDAMNTLHLMEKACSCSTVRGGGGRKVRARLCLWHSNQSTCKVYLPLRRSHHARST